MTRGAEGTPVSSATNLCSLADTLLSEASGVIEVFVELLSSWRVTIVPLSLAHSQNSDRYCTAISPQETKYLGAVLYQVYLALEAPLLK